MPDLIKVETDRGDFVFTPEEILRIEVLPFKEYILMYVLFVSIVIASISLVGGVVSLVGGALVGGLIFYAMQERLTSNRRRALSKLSLGELRAKDSTKQIAWDGVKEVKLTPRRLIISRFKEGTIRARLRKTDIPLIKDRIASLAQGKLAQ